jgi:large subunit ribosomal protein L15
MLINELPQSSWYNRPGKRLGRWNGSGKGNYSGKWCKGQKARTGGGVPNWFEWGQTALYMRLPKLRWFKQPKHLQSRVQAVTLNQLERDARIVGEVTKALLLTCGLIATLVDPVKVLATWSLTKKLSFVDIELYSAGARTAIEQVGGSCTA